MSAMLGACVCTPVYSQSYSCDRPDTPYIRSGSSADYDQMQRTQREVENYFSEMDDYLDCLKNESDDAVGEANHVQDEWETAVRRFNNQ